MNKMVLAGLLAAAIPVASKPIQTANNVDAWVPQWWANESVAILEENMVMANLVYRDFENALAESGEVVNTRKPGTFTALRKDISDAVTVQQITATNIPVTLNQHLHTTFLVKDKEQAKSFKDLVAEYLHPAMLSIAQAVDKICLSQAPRFLRTTVGQAGQIGVNASISSIVNTRKNLGNNKCPLNGRNFVVTTKDEAALLLLPEFTNAQVIGDDGTALREASIGRKYGFNFYVCQNTPYITAGSSDVVTGAVNLAAGYAAGTTVMVVDLLSAAIANGTWFTVAGDMVPHRVVSTTGAGTPVSITFTPGLTTAVADDAVITLYGPGAVDLVAGYAVNWQKPIVYEDSTLPPSVGQMVSFTAAGAVYVIISVDSVAKTITLDRPLEAALADEDAMFLGPVGAYNFAFVKNAIALVTRPMALPRQGSGATGAVANYKGLSVRVVWQYDGYNQGMLVTVDILVGIAVLDVLLGEVMLG